MATKKDLVEAYAFSRRRLVTAFVSGAPGGREVEPVRPGRVLIGGVALSVLLLAGAAIAGFLLGRPPAQWLDAGSFIISKDTGEQYVVLRGGDDPVIQRVPNYVSAQLLLGEAELTPFTVRDKYIRTVQLGEDLGIEGAPASLPAADELVDDDWTACTGTESASRSRCSRTRPWRTSRGRPSSSAAERSVADRHRAVGGQRAGPGLPLRDARGRELASTIGDKLGFGASSARGGRGLAQPVPPGLAPPGGSFGVTSEGRARAATATPARPLAYPVGDLLQSATGELLPPRRRRRAAARRLRRHGLRRVGRPGHPDRRRRPRQQFTPAGTPRSGRRASRQRSPAERCARCFTPGTVTAPAVSLATNPTGLRPTARAIGPGRHDVDVEPSAGAYVLSGSDEAARRHALRHRHQGREVRLIGPPCPDYIGYERGLTAAGAEHLDGVLRDGVPLSTNSARRVPEDAPPPDSES